MSLVWRFLNTEDAEFTEKRFRTMKHRCPICKVETDSVLHKDFPFCSERCRMQDLGNWASEKYVISTPVQPEESESDDDKPEPESPEPQR